jgi:hypothetical protein
MATDLQFYGINETLRYLKDMKRFVQGLRKDLKTKGKPLAQLVGSRFPDATVKQLAVQVAQRQKPECLRIW